MGAVNVKSTRYCVSLKGISMSKKGAQKTGSNDPGGKRKNSEMAAYMAKHGIKRTTFRCPITSKIVPMGSVPGMPGVKIRDMV